MPTNAPQLDRSFVLSFPNIPENTTNPAGITVAALVADGSIGDADGAVEAIAVTALDASLGAWQYSVDAGASWLTIRADLLDSATDELALLLGPTAQLRLLPFGALNGTLAEAVTFRAWDQSQGGEGQYVLIAASGGASAFSADSDSAAITVAPINAAPSFAPAAGSGKVLLPAADSQLIGSVALQPDGKIVAAGVEGYGTGSAFGLVRLNPDGSSDGGFDGAGTIVQPGADWQYYSDQNLALQADGKIVMGRYFVVGHSAEFGVVRLNADGAVDATFSQTGQLFESPGLHAFSSREEKGQRIAVQADGKILVAGSNWNGSNYDFGLARLNADGGLDTTFNGTGKLALPIGGFAWVGGADFIAQSVTVQSDGKIVVAGYSQIRATDTDATFSVARLNPDGSWDASFDGTGSVVLPWSSGYNAGVNVVVQTDGKIVVAGIAGYPDQGFSLMRLNADGSMDLGFNGTGQLVLPAGEGQGVAVQPDGKIIVAGAIRGADLDSDFRVLRLNADGSLDTSFNDGDELVLSLGADDRAYSVTVQPDGKIVVVGGGRSADNHESYFGAVRLNADGSLDAGFNGSAYAPPLDGLVRENSDGSPYTSLNAGVGTAVDTLGGAVAYVKGAAAVALDAAVAIVDPDLAVLAGDAGDYAGASVTLARHGGAAADDLFSARGALVLAGGVAALAGVAVGSYSNVGGTLTITFNGNATQARVDAVLSSIGYANHSAVAPASVRIDWSFSDGNAGAQGPGGALATAGSTTVNIAPVNAAPLLDAAAHPRLPDEVQGAANPAGVTVAALVADGSIGDPDGAVEAIAVTALDASLGAWQYSVDAGASWLTIRADLLDSATDELALLLGPTALLRLLPFGQLHGALAEAVTFRVWDRSVGAEGQYLSIDATGGTSAFSVASDSASLTVVAANAAPSFAPAHGTGKAILPISGYARGGALQADGKILVAGVSAGDSGKTEFSIARLNSDGSPDHGFSGTGALMVMLDDSSRDAVANSVAVQADGKIVLVGVLSSLYAYDVDHFGVVRLNADGSLDTGFNGTGKLIQSVSHAHDRAYDVALQADGKIVVAGISSDGPRQYFSLARLNTDGGLDASFNGTGTLILPGGSVGSAVSVAVQPDGKMVLAGSIWSGGSDLRVVRVNADGSLDAAFNGTAELSVPIGVGGDIGSGRSVILQADGKIIVTGNVSNGSNLDFMVLRLNADGALDTGFNGSGVFKLAVGDGFDSANCVAVQPDGKIVVAGYSEKDGNYDLGLVRLNVDGSLDAGFNGGGKLVLPVGVDGGISVQPDGKIVVTSTISHSGFSWGADFGVVRLNADGSLDASFNQSNVGADTLGGTSAYTENAAAAALDAAVAIVDPDLAALAGGAGDYSGASLTLVRHGGASADDLFSGRGELALDAGGAALLAGVAVGTYSNAGGTLAITFNGAATQARVDAVLSSIGYANGSDHPPAGVQIDWLFSDGNSGAQGAGGALGATGSSTVYVAPVNDAPRLTAFAGVLGHTDQVAVELTLEQLLAQGDEGDIDGTVNAFVIGALSSGALRIGASAAAAAPWAAGVNDTIDAAHHAYWTPKENASGAALDAFTVVARDDGGALSGAAVQVKLAVTDTLGPAITFGALALSSDTGASGTDFITATAAQTITATLSAAPAPGDTVRGSLDGGATWVDLTGMVAGKTLSWGGVTLAVSGTLKLQVSDGAGNAGVVTSRAYALDTDRDNIAGAVEDRVPGLARANGGAAAGDGNGDAIADSAQAAVASVEVVKSTTGHSNPGAAPTTYVSLVAGGANGKFDAAHSGDAHITSLAQGDAPGGLPAGLTMPLGLLGFTAEAPPGAAGNFSLYLDPALGVNGYWAPHGGVWVNLASAAYGGQIVMEGGMMRLDFKLADGGQFDTDPAAGAVGGAGAPAAMPLSLVGFAPGHPSGDFFF